MYGQCFVMLSVVEKNVNGPVPLVVSLHDAFDNKSYNVTVSSHLYDLYSTLTRETPFTSVSEKTRRPKVTFVLNELLELA